MGRCSPIFQEKKDSICCICGCGFSRSISSISVCTCLLSRRRRRWMILALFANVHAYIAMVPRTDLIGSYVRTWWISCVSLGQVVSVAEFNASVFGLVCELILWLLNILSIVVRFRGHFTLNVTFCINYITTANLMNANDVILNALRTHVAICYDVSCLFIFFILEQADSIIVCSAAPCRANKA